MASDGVAYRQEIHWHFVCRRRRHPDIIADHTRRDKVAFSSARSNAPASLATPVSRAIMPAMRRIIKSALSLSLGVTLRRRHLQQIIRPHRQPTISQISRHGDAEKFMCNTSYISNASAVFTTADLLLCHHSATRSNTQGEMTSQNSMITIRSPFCGYDMT